MANWYGDKGKRTLDIPQSATKSAPKPGDYPMGSVQSRAAARALMGRIKSKGTSIQVVYVGPDGTRKNGRLLRFPAPTDPEADSRAAHVLRERIKRYESQYGPREKQSDPDPRVEYHRV